MKRNYVAGKTDRVMWAMCVAAYILVADYFSPLCIIRADLDEGSMVEETPFGSSSQEDRYTILMATLAMYAAMNLDSNTGTNIEKLPGKLLNSIAERLQEQGKAANCREVMLEKDRLLGIATSILQEYHIYHLHLAAALMKGPVTKEMMEELKMLYCDNASHVA